MCYNRAAFPSNLHGSVYILHCLFFETKLERDNNIIVRRVTIKTQMCILALGVDLDHPAG